MALKKKELLLAAREMSQDEFDQLVGRREVKRPSLGGSRAGILEQENMTGEQIYIIEGERSAVNVSIEASMSEGETDMRCRGLIYTIKCYLYNNILFEKELKKVRHTDDGWGVSASSCH